MKRKDSSSFRTICVSCSEEFSGSRSICPRDGAFLVPVQEDPLIGQRLGHHYIVHDLLGYGGRSVVYKASHDLMERSVAIKMLSAHLLHDEASKLRLQREATAISMFDHQNLVRLYDCGFAESGQPYLVLDYLPGATLADLIAERGGVPVNRALPIFLAVCDALEHAHRHGVIHRDLKPGNIVLAGEDGAETVKIVDFGAVKFMPWAQVRSNLATGDDVLVGTPLYMSLEHAQSAKIWLFCPAAKNWSEPGLPNVTRHRLPVSAVGGAAQV